MYLKTLKELVLRNISWIFSKTVYFICKKILENTVIDLNEKTIQSDSER